MSPPTPWMTDHRFARPAQPAHTAGPPAPGRLLRGVGVLCILGALAVAGALAWTAWGTGLATQRANGQLRKDMLAVIDTPTVPEPSGTQADGGDLAPARASVERAEDKPAADVPQEHPTIPAGEAFGLLRIEALGLDYAVIEGTSEHDLTQGPGRYPSSAYPWEPSGTVAIAGHRVTYSSPFRTIDRLVPGDEIELTTPHGVFRYAVTGQRVVEPSDVSVLDHTASPTLVLTTCTPAFSSAHRLVVFADQIAASTTP